MASNVIIYDSNIDRMVRVGDGNRWLKRKAEAIRATAVTLAPKRSGRLKASHRVDQNRDRMGRFQTGFNITATAPYAAAVHEGTGPWIYPRNGYYLSLPGLNPNRPRAGKPGRNGRTTFVRKVRGQVGKPWLLEAARRHI